MGLILQSLVSSLISVAISVWCGAYMFHVLPTNLDKSWYFLPALLTIAAFTVIIFAVTNYLVTKFIERYLQKKR